MELKMRLVGEKELIIKLNAVKNKIHDRIYDVVKDTVLRIEATAKKSMRIGGGGGQFHSAPGEPPLVQTGLLRTNVTHKLPTKTEKEIIGKVGVRDIVPYAMALEYGYPPRNLAERPFMRPALAKEKPGFENKVRNILKGIVK